MEKTLTIPSETNIYNIIGESNKPLNTSTAPFEFYNSDDCGNDIAIDISTYEFDLLVKLNGCDYFLGSTLSGELVKEGVNVLYINIDSLTLDRGQYDYKISFTDGISVISGKLEVR